MEDTENTDNADESGSEENSTTFAELRKQRDEAVKRAKTAEAEVEEFVSGQSAARDTSAQEIVDALGLSKLKDDVLNWVEGDITEEAVVAALKERGIQTPGPTDQTLDTSDESASKSVSELSQRVADAAAGNSTVDVNERLNTSKDPDELDEIVDEAGIGRSYL